MQHFPLLSALLALLFLLCPAFELRTGAQDIDSTATRAQPIASEWSSQHAQHVLGLPDSRAKEAGTLQITGNVLRFTSKSSSSEIQLQSVFAVGAGNERVELWGVKGRLLRMAMPNGAGLFAATFMHHRVDMLTVEFGDQNGGYHAAVFFLPGKEAARAAQIIAAAPIAHREPASATCPVQGAVESASVRVPLPTWNDDQVPAAYRALLYEHLIADLRASQDVQRVYRDGETHEDGACAQYTLQIAITGFSKGNQVVRASTGPVGFFVDTTKLVFDVKLSRADGATALRDQIKTTVRGETESVKVAESMARRVVKEFAASQVQLAQTEPVRAPGAKAFR